MGNVDANQLGTWVKERRKSKGYTQMDLARRAGISRYHVIRIENGESATRRRTVTALAEALDAPEGDALQLAGFIAEASPAADIGAQLADIIETLSPADQQALCLLLREVARSWASSVKRTGTNLNTTLRIFGPFTKPRILTVHLSAVPVL